MQRKRRVPGLLRHSSGQARVILSGQAHYCGRFGTVDAQKRYAVLLERWEQNGRRPIDPSVDVEQARPLRELFASWEAYLDAAGRYHKASAPTSQRAIVAVAVREFVAQFGAVPSNRYSEQLLLRHRDWLEQREHLTRSGINRKIGVLRSALRWAFGRGLLSRDQWLGTSAVEPLTRAEAGGRDRKRPKRAVTIEEVEQVAAELPPGPAAMLRLQALTGMRPGEVCALRWCDIDRNGVEVDGVRCWLYAVVDGKTAHHGHYTTYALGPRAQQILSEFEVTAPSDHVFSPSATMRSLHDLGRAERKTPVTAYTLRRDAAASRKFAARYTTKTYGQAIERGILRTSVVPFSPHEVRHGFVTRAAQRYGAFAASVAANHARVTTTEGYLHRDRAAGARVVVGLEADAL